MNVQAHMSGQLSGQVPNQAGTSYVGLSQPNGNPHRAQMQNPGGQCSFVMDPELFKARKFMQEKIYEILMQRQPNSNEVPVKKMQDIVRRLEGGLFKSASSKEEYMNLDTLESRLHLFLKRGQMSNNSSQHSQFVNASASVGTMIPTPGMVRHGSSSLAVSNPVDTSVISSSGCSSMLSSAGSGGNFLPAADGSSTSLQGGNIMPTMSGPVVMSQMIPTPGFNSSNSNSYTNIETAGNGSGYSSTDSLMASQKVPVPQKHQIGAQNNRMTQNFCNQPSSGMRFNVPQRSYPPLQNGSVNEGFRSNVQSALGSGSSESYLTTTAFDESLGPSQRQFDQQSRPVVQGDGYGLNTTDSGSANLFTPSNSDGTMMNNQDSSQMRFHPVARSNSVMGGQPNFQPTLSTPHLRPQSSDRSEKSSFHQSSQSSRENLSLPPQQYHQQSQQFSQQKPYFPHQRLQKQANQQHQGVLLNESYYSPQLSSDTGVHVKVETGVEHLNDALQPQASGQLPLPEFQLQLLQSSGENHSVSNQFSSLSSTTSEMCSAFPQNPQQVLQPHQVVVESQNRYDGFPPLGEQSETSMQGQWHNESGDRSLPQSLSHEPKVQEEFLQRTSGHDVAQCHNLPSSEVSIGGLSVNVSSAVGTQGSGGVPNRTVNANRERHFFNQQKWLLFLQHARHCKEPEGKCVSYCADVKQLWRHMDACNASQCKHERCHRTKILIRHHKQCRNSQCPVCVPVNNRLMAQWKKVRLLRESDSGLQGTVSEAFKASDAAARYRADSQPSPVIVETAAADLQPSLKRIKSEHSGLSETRNNFVSLNASSESQLPLDVQPQEFQKNDNTPIQAKSEHVEDEMEASRSSVPAIVDVKKASLEGPSSENVNDGKPFSDAISSAQPESVKVEKDAIEVEQEDVPQSSDQMVGTKSGKPKIKGVSLTELFTPEQIREHIRGLRQWIGQSRAKAEKNQALEHSMSENSCQLCAVEKLTFEPPPIYCTRCGSRIKRNSMYYTAGTGDTRHYFCIPCYNEPRGDTIVVDGSSILKSKLEKKKNDEETEEWWVQCDKCEAWQHQICALFNGRRNDGGQAEYTCPNCLIDEVESGERMPLPQSAVLGAKDLPKTLLSDHIEQRMFKKLKQERLERARQQGKSYDEVPGAEGIVIRVVSSVDKKLEVKPRFLEIFREENYPTEFPYKSKVVLMFQKIEGVEVCLFGMYVQEFGSECLPPNQRRVYLSYLDSVKYFRPEIRAVTGEALRTFVYHEILIGYLEYCKIRGFASCYIWACPPLKGEDYILYCHPEIQKTPKSDKLREWYLSMLRKATRENIVVELTNLYDHFFVTTGECKAKVTASRLPYFDGDYWPGAAEDMIEQLNQEEEGRKHNKKGTTKKMFTKRTLKATGQSDFSSNASKDFLLMHRLGETILPMKDDFIMVHLQHSCSHCCVLMVSGSRWECKQCKCFQICDKCYEAEQKLEEREKHPIGHKEKHALYPIEISDLPEDTKDKDEILESEFFDTRQAFLSLCQGNHYQYDTLRRAKHSSMMVLYHLHNPTAPAFVTNCNVCHLDIETGQGWRCETCPDYDVCNACYHKEGGIDHPHKLTHHPILAERDAQNKEARQKRVQQLRTMLDLLVHASQCRLGQCQYPNCRKVKGLFRHGIQCKVRASGGCMLCKKMWYLLHLHARACKESECNVPRCRDLKEHVRRLQQQSDSRRRAAVMEMMRQRAAEVAGNA